MKKYIAIIAVLLFLSYGRTTFALTPVPTKAPTSAADSESLSQKIDHLKSVLASKVAELKLVDKRGIIGTIQSTTSTQITLLDGNDNTRLVDVDEFTKFSSGSATKPFGISDMKQSMRISVLGLYNKESQRIQARFIDTIDSPIFLLGTTTNVDKDNFLLLIQEENGTTEKVDIESSTKTTSYDDNLDPTKSGFSKITPGVRTVIIGFPDPKEKNRMTASRILTFPTLPKDPKVNVTIIDSPTPTAAPTATLKRTVTRTP